MICVIAAIGWLAAAATAPAPSATPVVTPTGSPTPPVLGTLDLNSDPWGDVWVDGKPLEHATPIVGLPLAAGSHRIRVVSPETHQRSERVVEISPGETVRVRVKLK